MLNTLFISYAHVDNTPANNTDCGWVDYFLKDLRSELNRQFGRKDAYNIWKDEELRGNKPLTSDILQQLENSQTLLVFHSKGYQASQWCQRELDHFTQQAGHQSGRIFFIEQDKQPRPEVHSDLLGYRFYAETETGRAYRLASLTPKSPETEYLLRVGDVAEQLFETICHLNQQTHSSQQAIKATFYLAQVSNSLISQREAVMRELKQHGYQAIPLNHKPDDIFALEKQMQQELEGCSYFVQLLDQHDNMGIPQRLFTIAEQATTNILQWRPRDLDIDTVEDKTHQQLLRHETVRASSLVEFQQAILKALQPKPAIKPTANQQKTIFINTGLQDYTLAETLFHKLAEQQINCILPLDDNNASAAEIREDLQNNLQLCDIALLIYKNSPIPQIRQLLQECLKINAKRSTPLKTAVCLSSDNPPLGMAVSDLYELYCDDSFDELCLHKLVQEVMA